MQNAIDQMMGFGLLIDGTPEIGRIVRVNMEDERRGKKSGWYILHEMHLNNNELVVVGAYGDHRRGVTEKIELKGREFTAEEKAAYKKQMAAQRKQANAERERVAREAAERAERIWTGLEKNTGGKSDYLVRKKVRPFGVRFSRGSIVVPVRNVEGRLVGLQFIDGQGSKKFLTGTAKRGAFYLVGSEKAEGAPIICIAEGFATAASIYVATSYPCAVAFDAGNLEPVARSIRVLEPDARIVVCCDNDVSNPANPGLNKGIAAAQAVGGVYAVPVFREVAA